MRLFLIIFIALSISSVFGQTKNKKDQKDISKVLDSFFSELENQDTVKFQALFTDDAQVWSAEQTKDSVKYGMRNVRDFNIYNPERVIHEKPFRYDITSHEYIASAWVPYTLSVNEDFSHCGIDVFTLYKTTKGWKIINISFTMEPNGCDEVKK